MPLLFKTPRDSAYDVEIQNSGIVAGGGKGGVPVEDAAPYVHELQDRRGQPLSGQALQRAAEKFAERHGLRVESVNSLDREQLRRESGAFPAGPTIEEIARGAAERDRALVPAEELATNPDLDVPPPDTTNKE